LVHGLLFIQRQACHKDRSPANCHPPTCPVATQASGYAKVTKPIKVMKPIVNTADCYKSLI
jgi:hypothetical protein